jgi:hypothetical protein
LAEAKLEEGSPIKALFGALETVNFEAVVYSMENAAFVERAYGNEEHANQLVADHKITKLDELMPWNYTPVA